ncbi:hypothetical protein B6N60_01572 [Richelia sinica FACHB-800]|uniref:Uncharacterized protein n=1 Tax=Richelia sinica FACHB-800 TaxID=1357546 RepID=A0A975T6B5_9NOST|nr:hypothetical protein [Richelia sinica]MBD2663562.1 hypothetical protein [Richelia sinica FACHB-800]QXE22885.1 hypothetical protein B6N60_01572 [Richelia sinica FACHB-800]
MNQILFAVVISYLLMTSYFLFNWLRFAFRHPTSTPEEKFLSFVMLMISTVLWPLMLPICCVKIFTQKNIEFSTIIPVLLAMFAFSLSYYLSSVHGDFLCNYQLFCPYAS